MNKITSEIHKQYMKELKDSSGKQGRKSEDDKKLEQHLKESQTQNAALRSKYTEIKNKFDKIKEQLEE